MTDDVKLDERLARLIDERIARLIADVTTWRDDMAEAWDQCSGVNMQSKLLEGKRDAYDRVLWRIRELRAPSSGYDAPLHDASLRTALDWIDAHGCDDDSTIAQKALQGAWEAPGCCPGH